MDIDPDNEEMVIDGDLDADMLDGKIKMFYLSVGDIVSVKERAW